MIFTWEMLWNILNLNDFCTDWNHSFTQYLLGITSAHTLLLIGDLVQVDL